MIFDGFASDIKNTYSKDEVILVELMDNTCSIGKLIDVTCSAIRIQEFYESGKNGPQSLISLHLIRRIRSNTTIGIDVEGLIENYNKTTIESLEKAYLEAESLEQPKKKKRAKNATHANPS